MWQKVKGSSIKASHLKQKFQEEAKCKLLTLSAQGTMRMKAKEATLMLMTTWTNKCQPKKMAESFNPNK